VCFVLTTTLSVVTAAMNLLESNKEQSYSDETPYECTYLHDSLDLAFITV